MKKVMLWVLVALWALPVAAQEQGEVCYAPGVLPKGVTRIVVVKPNPKVKVDQTDLEFLKNAKELDEIDTAKIEFVGVVRGRELEIKLLAYTPGRSLPPLPESTTVVWVVLQGSSPRYKEVRLRKDCPPDMFCIDFRPDVPKK